MKAKETVLPPVAIGGLGGSGTRVFAACLQRAGFAIGAALNNSLDNLWFTVLFKRAIWARERLDRADVSSAIELFQRAMTTGLANDLTDVERNLVTQLAGDLPPNGNWVSGARTEHAASLLNSGLQPGGTGQLWGWKEPNTHLFLPELNQHIAGFRYIHVVRNGLDMAYSGNSWQADHWPHHFELRRDSNTPAPVHQLRYWIAANKRALTFGRTHMKQRFMIMDYDEFCTAPAQQWPRLRTFLGLSEGHDMPDDLIEPRGIGRHRDHDLSIFPDDLLERFTELQTDIYRTSQSE